MNVSVELEDEEAVRRFDSLVATAAAGVEARKFDVMASVVEFAEVMVF